ncbi:hypothetical protein [Candidatus Nitrotoga sp. M5]|uniref:hypothetical protein n=1 Tax=Candidatus Nitrotoga sp. M5 TaxID=2890409 RepID=UPI001EF25BCD|nr:hypothetical protein [Candidatus Nitrotoga sp. M5]CAH1385759.1 hypothetical protein NTGM5_150076 [Candidatus Nitrotoga sp. M5]
MHRENLVRSMVASFKIAEPKEGIRRSYLWLRIIILMGITTYWIDYPESDLMTTSKTCGANWTSQS